MRDSTGVPRELSKKQQFDNQNILVATGCRFCRKQPESCGYSLSGYADRYKGLAVKSERRVSPIQRIRLPFRGDRLRYAGREQLGEHIGGRGAAEIETLRLVTLASLKKCQLFFGFHAFRNDP